ncbi:MAG: SDR family NAD(P)-dependent oxidoreductase [Lachnospira sp.]
MKTACITGASSGIGRELAKKLSMMGYNLILISRNTKALDALSRKLPTKCEIISCDLSDEDKCKELAETLSKRNIYIFINNAGFGSLGRFDETDTNNDLSMINVNIKAVHILTKAMITAFKKRDCGYIMNVASSAGLMPAGPYMSTYYATKSYVTSLTTAIHHELKESGSNVHICMLCPGPVDTNFNNVAGVTFSLPGISSSYCAEYALKKMFQGKLTIVPTLTMKLAVIAAKIFPREFMASMAGRQQSKKGKKGSDPIKIL